MKMILKTIYTILITLILCQSLAAKEQQQLKEKNQSIYTQSDLLLLSALENIGHSKIDEALTDLKKLRSINAKFGLAQ